MKSISSQITEEKDPVYLNSTKQKDVHFLGLKIAVSKKSNKRKLQQTREEVKVWYKVKLLS